MNIMVLVPGFFKYKLEHWKLSDNTVIPPGDLSSLDSLNGLKTKVTVIASNNGKPAWETISIPVLFDHARNPDQFWEVEILDDQKAFKGKGKVKFGEAEEQPTG